MLRLDWRGVSVLLTGDLGWPGEARVLERGLRCGRRAQGGPPRQPLLVERVLSRRGPARRRRHLRGARNPFRHPTPETLGRLEAAGARIYRTDRDGAIIVESDGVKLWITRWATRSRTFALEPAPSSTGASGRLPNTPRPPGSRGPWWDARRAGGELRPRGCARSGCAAAPAPRDRDACRGRAPSLPGWS